MNTGKTNIVVTGMGAITPIGKSVDEYWENLIAGKSGVGMIDRFPTDDLPVKIAAQVKDFEPTEYMSKKLAREMDLFMQYGYAAAVEALAQAGETDTNTEADISASEGNIGGAPTSDTLKNKIAPPHRMGIVIGTALGGITPISDTQDGLSTGEHKKVSPRFVPKIIGNEVAAQIAIARGYRGPSLTVSTACSSGGDAIATGCMLIASGQADAVLVVGAESALARIFIKGLVSAHALSTNENPETASRPFDRDRDGFVIGEGGGALVLETEDNAKKRGASPLAKIAGFANCTDGYHVTSPHPEGIGAIFCMEQALAAAGLAPSDIDYINTHGTSTPVGDPIETQAIANVFGDDTTHLKDMAVTSTKGATGHMMGAGGITEVIACIQCIREGIIPPTLNLDTLDEACYELNYVPKKSMEKNVRYAMSNSFGFGGQNSCIIVGGTNHAI